LGSVVILFEGEIRAMTAPAIDAGSTPHRKVAMLGAVSSLVLSFTPTTGLSPPVMNPSLPSSETVGTRRHLLAARVPR